MRRSWFLIPAAFGTLLAGILVVGVAGTIWLASSHARDTVLRIAENAAENSGLTIGIGGAKGSLLGELTIADLTIADAQGRWLEAKDVELAWHPWQLLRGRLQIATLGAGTVSVVRAPDLPSAENTKGSAGIPSFPLRIKLDSVRVERLELDDALFGKAVAMRIDGRADVARNALSGALHIDRLDEPGKIELEVDFNRPGDALALAVHVDEPGGGMIAELAGLAGKPPVRVTLTGEGPLSHWRGQLRAAIDGIERATFHATIHGRDTHVVTVEGQIDPHPFAGQMPADLSSLIGPLIDIRSRLLVDPGQARLDALNIDTEAVGLALSGRYDRDAGDWNIEASVAHMSPAASTYFGVALDQPSLTLEVNSTGERTEATARFAATRIEAQGAVLNDVEVAIDANGDSAAQNWLVTFAADGRLATLPSAPAKIGAKLLGPVSLRGHAALEGAMMVMDTLRVDVGPGTLLATGQYAGGRVDGTLSAEVADISGLIAGLTAATPAGARFATAVNYSQDGGLAFSEMRLVLPGGQIDGYGRLDPSFTRLEASLQSTRFDLGAVASRAGVPLSGRLDFDSLVTGPLTEPTVVANAAVRNGSYDGNALPPAELRADVVAAPATPKGNIVLTVHPPQGAVSLRTDLGMVEGGSLMLSDIRIAGPGLRGNGQIGLSLDDAIATGQFELDASDLAPALSSVGLAGIGSGKLRIRLDEIDRVQRAEITGSVAELQVLRDGRDLLRLQQADISVAGVSGAKSPITLKFSAEAVSAAGAEIRKITMDAKGPAERLSFDLHLSAPAYQDLGLNMAGIFHTDRNVRTIRLTRGSGTVRDRRFTILSGMEAAVAPESYQIRGLVVSGAELGQITADGSMEAGNIVGQLSMQSIPLSILSDADQSQEVRGRFDLTAKASGTIERPKGEIRIVARDIAMEGERAGPAVNGTVTLTVNEQEADLRVKISGLSETPLTADATVVRQPKGLGFGSASALSGRVSWHGAVDDITRFLPLVGQRVAGGLAADLKFSKTVGTPGISGAVVLRDGLIEDYITGLVLQFPRMEVVSEDQRVVVRPFEAFDAGKGKISGQGQIELDSGAGFPFRARLDLAQARLLNRDDVMAIVSGAVETEGNLAKVSIHGDLQSDRIEVNLDTGLPPAVVMIEVEEIPSDSNDSAQQVALRDNSDEPTKWETALDVNLRMPAQVFVRGRGLDSEWGGAVALTGSADQPRVSGRLTSRRGQFDFAERIFKLQSSVIDIAPQADSSVDALLNIKAIHERGNLMVIVTVSGTAAKPAIELSSVPALPHDEILSRLLFNKGRASLSPVEALQLANALRSLSGRGGPDPIAALRRATGIDVLRFSAGGADENTAPSLEAGKYVTDKVYLGVRQGAAPGTSAVAVEIDIFNDTSVTSEIRQDGGNRVGLKYKWDY